MRLTSQRGVSLLLLIIMITVFAGVATGVVTLLRSRHESYPYQVQSYQAYALAHAGIEFAIQYAKENNVNLTDPNSFTNSPGTYIPAYPNYKDFSFGTGKFSLSYQPGCPDMLYSRGTVGTATREVQVKYFGSYLGQGGSSPYMTFAAVTRTCYGSDCVGKTCFNGTSHYPCPADPNPGPYSGDRIGVSYCNPGGQNSWYIPFTLAGSSAQANILVAAHSATGQQVILARLGFKDNSKNIPVVNGVPTPNQVTNWQYAGNALSVTWAWDATCGITGYAGWGTANQGAFCPQAFTNFLHPEWSCPHPNQTIGSVTNPFYGLTAWPANAYPNLNATAPFVNCVTNETSGYYNFPKLPDWTNYPNAPTLTYPVYWNTSLPWQGGVEGGDQRTSSYWDNVCRPVLPCDPDDSDPTRKANCLAQNACSTIGIGVDFCPQTNDGVIAYPKYAQYNREYPCFDATTTCATTRQSSWTTKSLLTCYYPTEGFNPPVPRSWENVTLDVDLNRLVIETIGHVDPITPVTFYLKFKTQLRGSTVDKVFIFTVH